MSLTCFEPVLTRTADTLQKAGYVTTHMSVASIFPDSPMCYGPSPWAFDGKSSKTQKIDFFSPIIYILHTTVIYLSLSKINTARQQEIKADFNQ